MANKNLSYPGVAAIGLALLLAAWPALWSYAQPTPGVAVQIDSDDIGGVVTGKNGPEAGVWVIAETSELGTRFAKMVVTDDQGRYVIPDLPQATYNVWVRGYGLVDSPKVKSARGQIVNLTAVPAPSAAAAAEYYPAIYWFSMLKHPGQEPLSRAPDPTATVCRSTSRAQEQWLNAVQLNGCGNCHQLGDKATREIPAALGSVRRARRSRRGAAAACRARAATPWPRISERMNTSDGGHIRRLAEWTDRIRPASCRRRCRRGRTASNVISS